MNTEITLHHHNADATDVFGFWLYIMTDCLLFASLFAAFVVLHYKGAFGPDFKQFIDLKYVLGETFLLLGSNFTFGMASIAGYKDKRGLMIFFLLLTFVLGAGFVGMEVNEFFHLAGEGYSWKTSGAASAFFTLVGTHGLHVSFGLLWILILMIQFIHFGNNQIMRRRMTYLGMFWNFLEIVWVFLVSIVYLMGAM